MNAEIHFAGTHTRRDLTRATILHARLSPVARGVFLLLGLVAVGGTALLLAFGDTSTIPGLILMLLFVGAARLGVPRFMAARMWRTNAMHSTPVEGEASDEAISIRRPMTQTRPLWSQVRNYKLGPDIALLYISPFEFSFLGRTVFRSDEDWEAFRSLVRKHSKLSRQAPGEAMFLLGVGAACVVLFAWWFVAPGP